MHPLYSSNHTEDLWILFDCRVPGMRNRLRQERHAWGDHAAVENLRHGCAILIVRPGGAMRSAA